MGSERNGAPPSRSTVRSGAENSFCSDKMGEERDVRVPGLTGVHQGSAGAKLTTKVILPTFSESILDQSTR